MSDEYMRLSDIAERWGYSANRAGYQAFSHHVRKWMSRGESIRVRPDPENVRQSLYHVGDVRRLMTMTAMYRRRNELRRR